MNKQSRKKVIAAVQAVAPTQRVLSYTVTPHVQDSLLSPKTNVIAALAKEELRDHACGSCGTRVTASIHTPTPMCPCCGSSKMTASAKTYKREVAKADRELAGVACPSCKTTSIMHASVLKAAAGDVYCTSCGTPIHAHVTAAASDEADLNPEELDAKPAGVTGPEIQPAPPTPQIASEDSDEDEDEDDVETGAFDGDDDGAGGKKEDASTKPGAKQTAAGWPFARQTADAIDGDEEDEDIDLDAFDSDLDGADLGPTTDDALELDVPQTAASQTADFDGVGVEGLENADSQAFGGSTPGMTDLGDGMTYMEMDQGPGADARIVPENDLEIANADEMPFNEEGTSVADAEDLDDSVKGCFFVSAGTRLLALKGHHVVAALTQKAAGENASVMHTDAFATAVTNEIQSQGMRRALANFKFTPVLLKTESAATVRARVKAEVEKVQASIKEAEKVQADCFAIASVGLARGLWKNQKNALSASLISEFSALGAQRPERLVARLLSEAGPEYSHTLCSVASQLSRMTAEARKQFADMLEMVSEEPVADVSEDPAFDPDLAVDPGLVDDAVEPDLAVASRLSAPARATASADRVPALLRPQQPATRVTANAMANDMLAGNVSLFNF